MSILPEKLQPLVTKEDKFHVHKTLGILCLLSYLFRISMVVVKGDYNMGFSQYPQLTLPTLLLHLMLNVSSFGFKIPARRINSGYRIWPEYRAHSLVFNVYMLATILLYWYEQTRGVGPYYNVTHWFAIITRVFADASSSYYGDQHQSGFARQLHVPNYVKFFFSFMQLFGNVYFIYGPRHHYAIPFIVVIIIQGNAFLMTLRRKNVAGHYTLISIYGLALLLVLTVGVQEIVTMGPYALPIVAGLGHVAAFLRLGPFSNPQKGMLGVVHNILNNKYVIWTIVGLAMNYFRPVIDAKEFSPDILFTPFQAWAAFGVATLVNILVGWHKCKYGYSSTGKSSSDDSTNGQTAMTTVDEKAQ